MAFNYDPKDAKECLDAGTYPAELYSVKEKVSKQGNEMLEVAWRVPHDGRDFWVRDYIVNPSTVFKLKQIAKAWDLMAEFDACEFDLHKHLNKLITIKLDVQTSAQYGDQNKVSGYERSMMTSSELGPSPEHDGIPF